MKTKSKWLSVLVATMMLLTMMPFGMLANAADITSLSQITDMSGNYTLTQDITIPNTDAWAPIGTKTAPFTGTLDGNGHTISFGSSMKISSKTSESLDASYNGLFGYTSSSATIKNLKIDSSTLAVNNYDLQVFGFIAAYNAGSIQNCSVTNSKITINAVSGGNYYIGSVAGYNTGSITQTYSTSDIFTQFYPIGALNIASGGITGYNDGSVSLSYNTGTVSAEVKTYTGVGASYLGGIAGDNNKTITNCYNSGNISADSFSLMGIAGGITGENELTGNISLAYNAGMLNGYITGGIAGLNEYQAEVKDGETVTTPQKNGTIATSYYYDASAIYGYTFSNGTTDNNGKLDKTKMQTLSNFTGFDSSSVWQTVVETPDYPFPVLQSLAHVEAAENTTDYAGGNGTLYNPYQIANKTQLNKIRNSDEYMTSCYVLTNDILFTNWDFNSLTQNKAAYFTDISTAEVVDDTSSTSATPVELAAGNLTTLAELIASDKLPTAILINKDDLLTKTYAQITDWTGTFDGKTTDGTTEYTLTPVWKVPDGYTKPTDFTAPTFKVKVSVAQSESLTSALDADSDVAWGGTFSGTVTLLLDENITSLSALVASGKIPSVVKIKEGTTGAYKYRWWEIGDWTSSPDFDINAGEAGTYTLTQSVNGKTVTITLTVDKAQTAAITSPAEGEFYNGGLGWIPIGVETADTASTSDDKKYYTGDVDSFRGVISGNDGLNTHYIYNLKINANAVDSTATSPTPYDAYAGFVGVNNGVIQSLIIDNPSDSAKTTLLSCTNKIALFFNDTYSTYVNVSSSDDAFAGFIAGVNDVNGKISNVQTSGSVSTLASSKSYAGGIAGINRSYLVYSYNFCSVTSNSKSINASAGGIAGSNSGYIQYTANTGTVIAGYGTTDLSGKLANVYSSEKLYAGGITGFNSSESAKIIKSHNIGGVMTQITSASTSDNIYAGGLVGRVEGTLTDSTPANNTIDADSSCWAQTAKYSVEYASDAKTGYTTGCTSGIDTVKGYVKRDLGSGTTDMPSYETQTFLSFNFPDKAVSSPYTGAFDLQTAAETYVDSTITSSNGTIYDNAGTALTTTKGTTSKSSLEGTVKSGYELMKVTYSASGVSDQTVEFITYIAEAPTSLTLGTSNVKKSYALGDEFSTTGLTVTATYSNNSEATLSSNAYTVTTSYNSSSPKGDYTVTVTSAVAPAVTDSYSITASERMTLKTDSGLTIKRDATANGQAINYITGTGTNVSVSDLESKLNQTVIVKNKNGDTISGTTILGTGMTVELSDGSDPLYIVVKGDTNGDGDISVTDLLQAKRQQLGIISLSSASFKAADANSSGDISVTDLLQIKRHILKLTVLK